MLERYRDEYSNSFFKKLISNKEIIHTINYNKIYNHFYYKNKQDENINFALGKGKVFDSGCMKLLNFGVVYYSNSLNIDSSPFQSFDSLQYREETREADMVLIDNEQFQ